MRASVRFLVGVSFLLLVASCGGAVDDDAYVLRIDHEWDASTNARFTLADETYVACPPRDAYRVVFGGDAVEVMALVDTALGRKGTVVTGAPHPSESEGRGAPRRARESRFELDGGEGELVVRGELAVVTRFGSGVPVLSSERGTLVPRRD